MKAQMMNVLFVKKSKKKKAQLNPTKKKFTHKTINKQLKKTAQQKRKVFS